MINLSNKYVLLILIVLSCINNTYAKGGSIELDEIISHYKMHYNNQFTDSCLNDYISCHQFSSSDDIKNELDFYRFATSYYNKCCDVQYAYALYDKYLYSLELNELNRSEEYCNALLDYSLVCLSMPKWREALGYCIIADSIARQNNLSEELCDKSASRIELIQLLYGLEPSISNNKITHNNYIDKLIYELLYNPNSETVILLKEHLFNIEKSTCENLNEILYVHVFVAIANYYLNNSLYRDLDQLLLHVKDFVNRNNKPISFYCYVNYIAGRMFYEQGLYEDALSSLKNAKNSFENNDIISPCYFRTLEILSLCYLELQDKENAINTINALSSLFDDQQNDVGYALFYEYKTIFALVMASSNNFLIDNAVNIWDLTYKETFNKHGLLNEVHNLTTKILCLIAKNTGRIQILEELLNEVKESNMSILNKINLSKLLYDFKWKNTDNSIINDVAYENDYVRNNILSDICYYSELERGDLWLEDACKLTINNFLLEKYPNNDYVCRMCYDNTLLVNNLNFNSDNILRIRARSTNDSIIISKINTIDSLKSQIIYSRLNLTAPTILSSQAIDIEKNLVKSLLLPEQVKTYSHTWEDVKNSLNDDEVAIEIISILPFQGTQSYPMSFAALIITNESKSPKCILLGNIEDYKFELAKATGPDKYLINDLYSQPNNIYNLCWKRIQPELEGKKKVYFSTSSAFSAINFSAIKINDSERIGDFYDIYNLTSTNIIADRYSLKQHKFNDNVALFGNANFLSSNTQLYYTTQLDVLSNQFQYNNKTRGYLGFLIGTKIETDSIYELLSLSNCDVQKLSGTNANEKSFRNMSGNSPNFLHIATHGFNLSNPFNGREVKTGTISSELLAYNKNQFAMLSTGILLSNDSILDKSSLYKNDGIILSEDIAKLDLSNTELVVLSACQTGRGDYTELQGVIGLPRAFKLAGVKKILCSLWDVDDEATALLMICFYKNYLDYGSEYKALKNAQNKIKALYSDPYYWAGFILLDALD